MQGVLVRSLVRDLRSHKLCSVIRKKNAFFLASALPVSQPDRTFWLPPQGEFLLFKGQHPENKSLINLSVKPKNHPVSPWSHCLSEEAHQTHITHDISTLWPRKLPWPISVPYVSPTPPPPSLCPWVGGSSESKSSLLLQEYTILIILTQAVL